jgi:hypothetical protein
LFVFFVLKAFTICLVFANENRLDDVANTLYLQYLLSNVPEDDIQHYFDRNFFLSREVHTLTIEDCRTRVYPTQQRGASSQELVYRKCRQSYNAYAGDARIAAWVEATFPAAVRPTSISLNSRLDYYFPA